jgi:DHA1 family tetracycline resistance protein-like MFS transporter
MYFAYYSLPAVFVLYAGHRYQWGAREVGAVLGIIGLLDMLVQALLVGPLIRRFGDHRTLMFGLCVGAIGLVCMGLAPTGFIFLLGLVPNALRVVAMPTLQSLMTRCVSGSEQGQLQGVNVSLGSIAGVLAPLFFGAVFSISIRVSEASSVYLGAAFFAAALVLLSAGAAVWVLVRREKRVAARQARAMAALR